MKETSKRFFIIREDLLPDSIVKTAAAKEMLARGEAQNVIDAVDKQGMARSTFYKYKDGVFSFFDGSLNIINITLLLQNISGILSGVLNCIAVYQGNILTINQNLPLHGVALVTVSIGIEDMTISVNELLDYLKELNGVMDVKIIGKS